MPVRRVALLTAGGFAPCLSSAVGGLIERYTEIAPEVEIIAYQHGYHGLLKGEKVVIDDETRKRAGILHRFGGSPIGNSRVKLTNAEDCLAKGLITEGQNPLEVAAEQLKADGVDVLHTIGGDDTNTTAADLAAYLEDNGYHLSVVGLPKTIDNDVVPIRQSLGAWTAAEQTALFAEDMTALGVLPPHTYLGAVETIPMVADAVAQPVEGRPRADRHGRRTRSGRALTKCVTNRTGSIPW